MALYKYQGRDASRALVRGTVDAESSHAVAQQLLEQGITPIEIKETTQTFSLFKAIRGYLFKRTVATEELVTFCRQMYTLVKAGVPMLQILTRLSETMRSAVLVEILKDAIDTVAEGHLLSEAFKKYPDVFKPVFISVLAAGESTGQLEEAFMQLGNYLDLEFRTVKQVKAATRYPIIVVVALVIAFTVVNFMVIPAFTQLFAKFKAELPLPTRILMAISDFVVMHWKFLLAGILAIFFGVRAFVKTRTGGYLWDFWKLRLPIVGPLINRIMLARFTRTFSMIMRTGIPLAEGVPLVANAVGNEFIRERVLTMRQDIERGESLTNTAIKTKLFSPLVIQMLSVGEQSGAVDTLLEQVAEFYEREVDYDLKRLADMIEPLLLILMGGIVLLLALGIFLPMWNMVQFVQR